MALEFPYGLAVCTIIRNEAKFLREWIEWHVLIGVSKFYLYDNDSDDDTAAILRPYVQKGLVEYIFYPGRYRQIPAYNDCVVKHRYDCEWIAFIDCDEFLHPLGEESVLDILREMKKGNEYVAGMAVNWRMYGSSGYVSSPGGVIAHYIHRAEDENEDNKVIKSIVNPRRVRCFFSAHYPVYYHGFYGVDERGDSVLAHLSSAGCQHLQRICLAHYCTKSWEDWQTRRDGVKADSPGGYDVSRESFENKDAAYNRVLDDSLLRMREEIISKQGHILKVPRVVECNSTDLEQYLHDLLKRYPVLDLEQVMILYHICSNTMHKEAEGLSSENIQKMVVSLLHLYLSCQGVIQVGDYDMLTDELRRLPPSGPGSRILFQDLERMKPAIKKWRLTHSTNDHYYYIDRLIRSRQPNYVPQIALIIPSLEEKPETEALLEVAKVLREEGLEITVYAVAGGGMMQTFVGLGIAVLVDGNLLEKELGNVDWYAGYDLVWLNTARCVHLLREHRAPVLRPIIWWLLEERISDLKTFGENIAHLKPDMVTILVRSQEIREVLEKANGNWPIPGQLAMSSVEGDKGFAKTVKSLVGPLVRWSISHRIPFEEGVK